MAAAILMVNIHGAVMAADKDLTVFRYSDKVSFAIMVDPLSRLQWEDIIIRYQTEKSINCRTSFQHCTEDFAAYLTDIFNREEQTVIDDECDKKVICVGYDNKTMFPQTAILTMQGDENGIRMQVDFRKIDLKNPVLHLYLGNCANIRILFGGMCDDLKDELVQLCVNELGGVLGNSEVATELISQNYDDFSDSFDRIQNDPQVTSAISDFTIKDMVAMAENLIDTESLLYRGSNGHHSSTTCEIGIVTMAEGFKWIKHSLYGA